MKQIIGVFCVLLALHTQANEDLGSSYEVISDVYDASIPKGKYVLEGRVLQDHSGKSINQTNLYYGDVKVYACGKNHSFSVTLPLEQAEIEFRRSSHKVSYFEGYDIQDQHRIKINIRLVSQGKVKEFPAEKPVLYAYSDHPTDVQIELKTSGKLLFSYPLLSDSSTWNVHLEPDRMMQTSEGQDLPYLFWESTNTDQIEFSKVQQHLTGRICRGNETTAYLDSALTTFGFNAQEKTDFITYWGPRLNTKKLVFIQFLQNEQCEQFAHYNIEPKPDVFNRIFMVFQAFENYPSELKIIPQSFDILPRKGFHLLEWGGIEYEAPIVVLTH